MTGLSSQQATHWREGRPRRAWELSPESWPPQRLAAAFGWSRQKPSRRAQQRDEEAIRRWKEKRWPALKKVQGRRPDHRLRGRNGLLLVAPGGQDLCH